MIYELFKVREVQRDFVIGIVISILTVYYIWITESIQLVYNNYGACVSLSATLLGFLITSFTILLAFPINYKIQLLKEHAMYPMLFGVFLLSIYTLIVLFILSIAGSLLHIINFWYCGVLVLMLIWSVLCVIRTVWILKKLTYLYLSGYEIEE